MTTPNIEELITYLRSFFIDENVSAIKANQIANALQSQAERITGLEKLERALKEGLALACIERDTLRAQLASIAATEPVAYRWVWKSKPHDIEGWCYTSTPPTSPELQEIEKLFTHPMPAQGVEASMIKLPEPDDTYCGVNYYTESQLKQAVRDALDAQGVTELVELLEFMWRDVSMNEYAFEKLEAALSKYKGAK